MRILIFIGLLLASASAARAQDTALEGKVLDAGTRLPLADVSVVSGNRGVQTDTAGHFSIPVKAGAVITVSYVGYLETTYTLKPGEQNITVELSPDAGKGALGEVVTVGYTKRSKLLSPAAITTITADDIKDVPTGNVADLLQGKIAGVNIQSTSGAPGARSSIFQRGLSNLNVSGEGNNAFLGLSQPLMIIDGVPIDPNTDYEYGFAQAGPVVNPLTLIPAEDIESIQILKDAAATSQYGSRGAYGVWIINTKRGRSGVPQVNYVGSLIINTVPPLRETYGGRMERALKVYQMMHYSPTLQESEGYALINKNLFLSDSLNPYYNNSTNWQSYFFSNQVNQSHNLTFSGGDAFFGYKVNLGYYDESGIIKNTGLGRYSMNLKADYMSKNSRFKMTTSVMTSSQKVRMGSGVGVLQTGVATSGNASTLLPPPDIYTENDLALAAFEIRDDNKVNALMGNIDMTVEILKNLKFQTVGSTSFTTQTSNTLYPSWLNANSAYGIFTGAGAQSQYNTFNKRSEAYYNRNVLSYLRNFNDSKHTVSSYVFTDLDVRMSKSNAMFLYGTPNDFVTGPIGYNLFRSRFGTSAPPTNIRAFGYGGNLSYNFKQKYILEFNYRIDGNSTNGPLSGYSHNPSVAVKWNFFKEKLLQPLSEKWLDYASLRGSWGRAIVPQGNVFDVYGTYYPGTTYMGQPTVFTNPVSAPNSYFLPNTSVTWNLGYESSFFNGRLMVVYDAYYKTVENMKMAVPTNRESGFSEAPTNELSMVNYGHELSLTLRLIQSKNFRWELNPNGALNRNVLTHLPDNMRQYMLNQSDVLNLPVIYRIGRESITNYLYTTRGVYSTYGDVPVDPFTGLRQRINNTFAEAGDPQFADINGDYTINELDRMAIGNPQPKLTGGLTNILSYKDFTLTVQGVYIMFRDVLNTPLAAKFMRFYSPDGNAAYPPIDQYDYWRAPGDVARYPFPYDYQQNQAIDAFRYNQTLFQEDGSYFKLSHIILAYNVPKPFLKRLRVKSARISLTGQNLVMISNYSGPNPETITDLGRDNPDSYPTARKFSINISATF